MSHIHEYSDNAITGIKKFDEIGYDFSHDCQDRCRLNAIDSFKIVRKLTCPCGIYGTADSVVQILYKTVLAYFGGLSKLAENDLTNYGVAPITKALKNDDLKLLGLKREDVDAYSQLTDILLRSFSEPFRQKKIREYIRIANLALQVILSKLGFIESKNLTGLLEFKKERLFERYHTVLRQHGMNDYEKLYAATDYYAALAETESLQTEIILYSKNLKIIAAGHQKITENLDKISTPDLKRSLTMYASEIRELISDFDKIKP